LSPPADPVRRFGRLVVEHQGLAVPLGYVALILLGTFHMVIFYARFRINALDFSEPSDFLLAPLADPFVIVVSILPFFVIRLLQHAGGWAGGFERKRSGKVRTEEEETLELRRYRWVQIVATALWIAAFSLTYSRIRAERVQDGKTPRMHVELTNGTWLGSERDSTVDMIGTTTQYAFFYVGRRDSSTGPPSVTIVPVESVARMDISARRQRRR
jgi:hypothetical protein